MAPPIRRQVDIKSSDRNNFDRLQQRISDSLTSLFGAAATHQDLHWFSVEIGFPYVSLMSSSILSLKFSLAADPPQGAISTGLERVHRLERAPSVSTGHEATWKFTMTNDRDGTGHMPTLLAYLGKLSSALVKELGQKHRDGWFSNTNMRWAPRRSVDEWRALAARVQWELRDSITADAKAVSLDWQEMGQSVFVKCMTLVLTWTLVGDKHPAQLGLPHLQWSPQGIGSGSGEPGAEAQYTLDLDSRRSNAWQMAKQDLARWLLFKASRLARGPESDGKLYCHCELVQERSERTHVRVTLRAWQKQTCGISFPVSEQVSNDKPRWIYVEVNPLLQALGMETMAQNPAMYDIYGIGEIIYQGRQQIIAASDQVLASRSGGGGGSSRDSRVVRYRQRVLAYGH